MRDPVRHPLSAILLAAATLVAVAGSESRAAVVPASQDRSVSVTVLAEDPPFFSDDADSRTAPDFGPFQESVGAVVDVGTASASGDAGQESLILASGATAAGSISAGAQATDFDAFGTADAESRFELGFDLTAPASFTLTGSLIAEGSGFALTRLDGPEGTVVLVAATSDETVPVLESGALESGTYTFLARASATVFGDFFSSDSAGAGYDVELLIDPTTHASPEGADRVTTLVVRPNPFRDATRIGLRDAPLSGDVLVLDVRGRTVRRLPSSAGQARWDGRDASGSRVGPGVYFVRRILESGGAPGAATKVVRR